MRERQETKLKKQKRIREGEGTGDIFSAWALSRMHVPHLLGEVKDALTGDALQDGAIERRGDKLLNTFVVLPVHEQVHRANLSDLLIVIKEPEHLLATALC